MSAYRAVWWGAAAATVGLGAFGAANAMPPAEAVGIFVTMGVLGGALGYAWSKELPRVRHPVLAGAGLSGGSALVLTGLIHLLGPFTLALLAALLLTSPYVTGLVARWLRARILPPDIQRAGLAAPDEALERQWIASTALLETASTAEDRLIVVQARAEILDDLTKRGEGRLPGYVWPSSPRSSRQRPSAGRGRDD